MVDSADAERFAGTAEFYAEHRPGYGPAAIEYLVERFGLDGSGRVLDLGCGTGQLTLPLGPHAGEVVAMDPNPAMLDQVRRRIGDAGIDDVIVREGSDETLHGQVDGDVLERLAPLRLTTMGRSFHWMDGRATLDALAGVTEPGGGVALITDGEWLTGGQADWMAAVHDAVGPFGDVPDRVDPATVEYDDPWNELLEARGFTDVRTRTFDVEREWAVDGVVGYVRSLSFCAPRVLEGDTAEMEQAIRGCLGELGDGPFPQTATVEVISGRVPPTDQFSGSQRG